MEMVMNALAIVGVVFLVVVAFGVFIFIVCLAASFGLIAAEGVLDWFDEQRSKKERRG